MTMGHIQNYRDRQYFSKELSGHEVSQGIKQIGETFNNTFNSGLTTIQKANESNLANNQIDLSTRFLAKNNEINTKYQADPNNPEREREIQEAFETMASDYKINPLCKSQWNNMKNNIYNRYKTYNAQWVENQQQTNIQNNLKNGYETLNNQISMLGLNGSNIDEMKLVYANGIEALRNSATVGLGEMVVNDFLKDSDHDFMTSYVSALAINNPIEAQKLINDEGVRNDIGRADTIEKLENYISNSLNNQNKRTAVKELGNTLRNMNSDEAEEILNGKADLTKVMKFIETNKNIPEGSKDMILGIYGISSTTEYIYDRDKKRILKKDETGSKSSSTSALKMSALDKKLCSEILEQDLHNLLSFSNEETSSFNIKDVKKNKGQQQASDFLIGYMQQVANMQGRIDTAYNAGAIDKSTRNRMMNNYLQPITDYLESNLEQLDEKKFGLIGSKLGYENIKRAFNTDDLKGQELEEMQRQKLFAQNYYLDELYKATQKTNLPNIYAIESLPSEQQKEIYKTASENALKRAKRWTDKPELFFAQEYPEIYSQPFIYFGQNEALAINRAVAEAVFKREFEDVNGNSTLNLKEYAQMKTIDEINKQANINRAKAQTTLRNQTEMISAPTPKNWTELKSRVEALGINWEQFKKDSENRGFVHNGNKNFLLNGFSGYVNALNALEYADSQKARKELIMGKTSEVFAKNTKYDDIINEYSEKHGVDPLLIKSIVRQESGFNSNAKSKAGAGGLMQLMPATAKEVGVNNVFDPKQNLEGGIKYFSKLLNRFDGDIQLALAAYNAGAGNVKKYGNKVPPFKETQNYVKNIMAMYNEVKEA